MLFSQYSNAQVTIGLPQYGLYIGGNVRFSPGDGFIFGRRGGSFGNTFNINQALINPPESYVPSTINYGWEYNTSNPQYLLSAQVSITSKSGDVVYKNEVVHTPSKEFSRMDYNYQIAEGYASQLNGIRIDFSTNSVEAKDPWDGPSIRNIYSSVTYEQNTCAVDVLSSPNCKGYSRAVVQRVCEINPRTSPDCPGYRIETPAEIAPIPDVAYADMLKTLTNPASSLSSVVNAAKKDEPIQPLVGLRVNPPRDTRSSTRTQVVRSSTPDPQTERMQEMQQAGPNLGSYTSVTMKDAPFYRQRDIYRNVVISDNVRAQRQLTQRSNISHGRMVDEQYRR